MWESIQQLLSSVDIWAVVIKVLVTALLSTCIGVVCTLLGKLIARCKNSKIRAYATVCVEAAEQKFPNEGTKMGPQKMEYVMDQLAIKFPKIKENTYLYNIAEAAVYQLNEDKRKQIAIKEFEEKYGEKPIAAQDQVQEPVKEEATNVTLNAIKEENSIEVFKIEEKKVNQASKATSTDKITKLTSF